MSPLKRTPNETDIDRAERVHAEAVQTWNRATTTAAEAHALVATLRTKIVGGDASVTPQDLASAEQAAAHADLVAEGAAAVLPELSAAATAARADEACDQIVGTLPALGGRVADAIAGIEDAIAAFADASAIYDAYVNQAAQQIGHLDQVTERVHVQRHAHPTVDGIEVRPSRPHNQLAAIVAPAMKHLGAPLYVANEFKVLADAAPRIPTA